MMEKESLLRIDNEINCKFQDRVVIVAHCILNQATRAKWDGGGVSRVEGAVREVISTLIKRNVGIIQMDCPEFILYRNPRPPKSWDDYNTIEFRRKCREIVERTIQHLKKGNERTSKMELLAVLGFEDSPSCGVERTTKTIDGVHRKCQGKGHLIEFLDQKLKKEGFYPPFIGISLTNNKIEYALKILRNIVNN
jgi:predicted secreted protein